MNKDNSQPQTSRLMAVNEMFYKMPAPLSVSVVTTQKKQYASRNLYTAGQTVVFDIQCNAAVDPEKSYIKFDIKNTGLTFLWGSGSALNVIREVRITSKNGAELDRISNFNMYARYHMKNCVAQEELEQYGDLWGYAGTINAGNQESYVIPLKLISGLFRPHGHVKLPPSLLSGSRIELVLEDASNACFGAGAAYEMINPEIQLQEHQLSDNALKVLTEEAANNGLELTYDRIFVASESNGTNSQFNTLIKKAVSQATKIAVVPVPTVNINNALADSFVSIVGGVEFSKYQFRLASSYFPNQEVNNIKEAYCISSQVCDMHKTRPAVKYVDYIGAGGDFSLASQIKSDDEISSSGMAINNSASLAVNIETNPVSIVAKTHFIFLTYTALARCFISQISVKI